MTDTKFDINCPACGCKMQKIFVSGADVDIDICTDGCGGILFDNRELEKMDSAADNIDEILEVVGTKVFKTVYDDIRNCPICNTPMVKMGAHNSGVTIDVCNVCGAKFLDNGELEKIRNSNEEKNEKIDELSNLIFQNDLHSIIGDNLNPKSSKIRSLFEKIVYKIISR
ncbi:zf-TFIIB domain-containing protein [bacterium]|nr:zf-TFIIB domain-containing protein [bacterium]